MASTADDVIRPVGSGAMWNVARHRLGLYRCVIGTCQYTVPAAALKRGRPLRALVTEALARVVLRHGLLRAGIRGEDSPEPAFVHVRAIDMARMVEWADVPAVVGDDDAEDYLLRALERQHELLWEDLATKPGWKLIVFQYQSQGQKTEGAAAADDDDAVVTLDMAFCYHHCYADGKSMAIFHRDMVRELNRGIGIGTGTGTGGVAAPAELQGQILHLPRPPVLPDGLETIVPFRLTLGFQLRMVWEHIILKKLPACWLWSPRPPPPREVPWGAAPVSPEPYAAHIRGLGVPQAALDAVLRRCRANGATLTTLLHALVLDSAARRLPAGEGGATAFRALTSVNLDRVATPGPAYDPANSLHCLVTSQETRFDSATVSAFREASAVAGGGVGGTGAESERSERSEALVWSTARSHCASLRAKVASLPRDDITGLMHLVGDWDGFFTSKYGKPRDASWDITNGGSMRRADCEPDDDGEEEGWRIVRSVFTQGATVFATAFTLNVTGVEGRGVYLALSWQEGVIGAELGEGILADIEAWVGVLAAAGEAGES